MSFFSGIIDWVGDRTGTKKIIDDINTALKVNINDFNDYVKGQLFGDRSEGILPPEYDKFNSENFYHIYWINKLTNIDTKNDSGRTYIGISKPETYYINKDYLRRNEENIFFHLPDNYIESTTQKFSHRIAYSQQSFSEEQIDNYKVFLSNNFADIQSNLGFITNLFTIKNNLFIHCSEGLWHLPQNIQERVSNSIVSFIGTGNLFSIPPREIIDENSGNSAGIQNKNSFIKSLDQVFFVSEIENKIYKFNGNSLEAISNIGLSQFFNDKLKNNQYKNNFALGYDSQYNRIIFSNNNLENSFTISYSLEINNWLSFHSYNPTLYINSAKNLYSITENNNKIWKHNDNKKFGSYYGEKKDFIIEYTSVEENLISVVWNTINLISKTRKFDFELNDYYNISDITFNKCIISNDSQSTGLINLYIKKDNSITDEDFLKKKNDHGSKIVLHQNNEDWTINTIRDHIVIKNKPFFSKSIKNIDKEINDAVFDYDILKPENIKSKYISIRLYFTNKDDNELILNYSKSNTTTI